MRYLTLCLLYRPSGSVYKYVLLHLLDLRNLKTRHVAARTRSVT
jgi:hypothetical protein